MKKAVSILLTICLALLIIAIVLGNKLYNSPNIDTYIWFIASCLFFVVTAVKIIKKTLIK